MANTLKFIILALLSFYLVAGAAYATVSIVNASSNATYWLHYDSSTTFSYKDAQSPNDDIAIRVCQPGYDSLAIAPYYIAGNTTFPLYDTSGNLVEFTPDPTGCTNWNDPPIQIASATARFPGLPYIVFSNLSFTPMDVNRDQFEQLDASTGWLVGSFYANMSQSGSNVTVKVTDAYTGILCTSKGTRLITSNHLSTNLVVGIYDSDDNLIGSGFARLNVSKSFNVSGTAAWIRINGLTPTTCNTDPKCPIPNMICPDGTCAWTCLESGGGGTRAPKMNKSIILNSTGGTYFNPRMNLTGWANATPLVVGDNTTTYFVKWFKDGQLYYSDHVSNASPFTSDSMTLALWHMDEASGTNVADATGRYNATANSNTTITNAKFGKGRQFALETIPSNRQSVGQIYSNLSSSLFSGMSALTLEMWVRPSLPANYSGNKTSMDYMVLGSNLSQLKFGYSLSQDKLFATAIDKNSGWNSTTITSGGIVRSLAESQSGLILAATDMGVYSSSDYSTWNATGLSTVSYSLLVAPDGNVYAAADDGMGAPHVYYSNGDLSSWTDTGGMPGASTVINQLAQGPDGTIYAASDVENIYSYSGGTWQESCSPITGATTVTSLFVAPNGVFLAGTGSGEIYKSSNCSIWTSVYSGSLSVNSILLADDGTL